MRVVLDANILVRANEKSAGPARALLLDLIARGHVVLTSADILIELASVLRYPKLHALFGLSEEQIYEYVQFLKSVCKTVPIEVGRNVPIRDAADAPVPRTVSRAKPISSALWIQDFYAAETTAFCAIMGIRVLDDVTLHCYVDHGRLTSSFRGDPSNPRSFTRNKALFDAKWG